MLSRCVACVSLWTCLVIPAFGCTTSLPAPLAASPAENSSGNLKHLLQDALNAAKHQDQAKLNKIANGLLLPDSSWFASTFGSDLGDFFSKNYDKHRLQIPAALVRSLSEMQSEGFTTIAVDEFTSACDNRADKHEYPVLVARQSPERLAHVRFLHGNEFKVLGFFAFANGFRFLGSIEIPDQVPHSAVAQTSPGNSAGGANSQPGRNSGNALQPPRVIKKATIEYPSGATRDHITGDVKMAYIVDKDGHVSDVRVISGVCVLAEAAVETLRRYIYSPATLNGQPIPLDMTLTITYDSAR